ncbi:arachidonate 12-lipoxygenase, 12R-type-like [Pelobates fuscus]|uniref:arachidonate 12-lipoxygenase, 12R-type-like n=1 Tax=Pelobates fuscus TaxID=191477 RepID=UPI002FE49A79
MSHYKVKVATGEEPFAGTVNYIYIVLVGDNGETPKQKLDNFTIDFVPGAVDEYTISSKENIGEILYVRLYKEYHLIQDEWFCKYVTVTSPKGDLYQFPCYQWLSGNSTLEIPEGKGKILLGDVNPLIVQQRRNELDEKRSSHRWRYYSDGMPYCIDVDNFTDLLLNDQYSSTKMTSLITTRASTYLSSEVDILKQKVKSLNKELQDTSGKLTEAEQFKNKLQDKCISLDKKLLENEVDLEEKQKLIYSVQKLELQLDACEKALAKKQFQIDELNKTIDKHKEDVETIELLQAQTLLYQVSQIWKEDTFFGYQFLNGTNPLQIRKCLQIPDNFPVDDKMVAASLGTSTSLQDELQNGNLFLADYKILQGIQANTINGQQQYLAAPLCLLWKQPLGDIVPIAIQLGQTPGEDTPIFLPSDPEWDWTLAKMWVRNVDFQVHEALSHWLYTHLFAEVFTIATTRQLPMGHPVYKLIIPHLRYTLMINVLGRQALFNPGGTFDQIMTIGIKGMQALSKKVAAELTYDSLCVPKDIENRGMESIPNYFYRDDGMKIWLAIESFVSEIVHYYYKDDGSVSEDPELQAWAGEIFTKGFLDNQSSGIPSSLETRMEMVRYLTTMIFTCSAKHAAVNSGQFDFCSWMPNCPSSMRKPPPTTKGKATLESILETLPQVNTTTTTMSTVWELSNEPKDQRPLGNYPEERFTEDMPKKLIQDFQKKLSEISSQIKERNKTKSLTYPYLDPERIENSVSI